MTSGLRLARVAIACVTAWHCVPAVAEPWHVLVEQRDQPAAPGAPRTRLNSHRDMYDAIYACYRPPPLDRSLPGMQITVQVTFRRDGSILGEPRITYETPDASEDQRYAYRLAVAEALQRCTPLPFSDTLGRAVAGRPFGVRFIEIRQRQQI